MLAEKLFSSEDRKRKRWANGLQKKLDAGKIEALVGQLRCFPASSADNAELLRIEADYFSKNQERMRYADFQRQNLFIGSGVIEAACKTVICQKAEAVWNVLDRSRR